MLCVYVLDFSNARHNTRPREQASFSKRIFFIFIYFAISINSAKKTTPANFQEDTKRDYNHAFQMVVASSKSCLANARG